MGKSSVKLCMSGVGARPAAKAINHFGHANDLCLLAMSGKGMQTLHQICEEYMLLNMTLSTIGPNQSVFYLT